jgi:hypothetical protein
VIAEANLAPEGLSQQLLETLTASPADPYLKGLTELFLNFWGEFPRTVRRLTDRFLIRPQRSNRGPDVFFEHSWPVLQHLFSSTK